MEQQRALNALEPFLALSKSATSPRAAADIVTQATSASNTFVFAELLATPNIQALRNSDEYASYLRLLEIFAWGSINDYTSQANLPKLNHQQTEKLQLLTLLPLLTNTSKQPDVDPLSYGYLQNALGLKSSAVLESLVQTALYASLLQGHLDPLNRRVAVTSVSPLRDLAPNSIPSQVKLLEEMESRCSDVLSEIEAKIQQIKAQALKKSEIDAHQSKAFEDEMIAREHKDTMRGNAQGDSMDLDDGDSSGRSGGHGTRGVKRNLRSMFAR